MPQPSNNSILDQFINSQEQTYEEFLSTFTYLWKGMSASRVSHNKLHRKRKRESLNVICILIMMAEGWKVGCSNQGDLSLARRVKVRFASVLFKVGIISRTHLISVSCIYLQILLLGVGKVSGNTVFASTIILREGRTLAAPSNKFFSLCGDEVQLLSLDEEFDYDNVALTPKFSAAEMKAIINLSEQKKVRIGLKSPGYED
uniref:Intraflagellar transport associated protein n=1 Tax=Chelydra serpentina TaxID=8475 RepID=A0A8C3RPV6_CHESE